MGISGSLRTGSFNTMLLKSALSLAPQGVTTEIAEIGSIPIYNADLDAQAKPESVHVFMNKIRAADALVIATPEYNYSIPGVLKNAIDWASRPPQENAFAGKPLAILSASTGLLGGARAQYHLRQCCVFLDMHPVNKPEVMVSKAQDKFDSNGALTDEIARELIRKLMASLSEWTTRLNR